MPSFGADHRVPHLERDVLSHDDFVSALRNAEMLDAADADVRRRIDVARDLESLIDCGPVCVGERRGTDDVQVEVLAL